ncbi:glycoside hydrolase family 2 protein [Gryllotalpicola ginsengisoli]|uniref:glycoside hydrolase family 2 protein n=1 Tax=Gryllotalpicola ginsengisoli TaxID=444608 RepID=UPI0003B4A758|nr:glycoside hydrolase family 2 [Gryllotalpicola ginsengisoli]
MTLTVSDPSADSAMCSGTPRPEYPRPHFDRSARWSSLNGKWDFRRGRATGGGVSEGWLEQITVPFAWETPASGIQTHWLERAAYRRTFTVDPEWLEDRIILHFGAVHHAATVWVNGARVGSHEGGYTPFEFDITDALTGSIEHELVVEVFAPTDKHAVAHGKQRSMPRDDYDGCAFTPSSGIWQSVWLEPRPQTYLSELGLTATSELNGIRVIGRLDGPSLGDATVVVSVEEADAVWRGSAATLATGVELRLDGPRLWSPEDPYLYRVRVEVTSADGTDTVIGTTGLRRIETRDGMFFLNGRRISLRGVLDQGYWPASGITAPTDEAFVRDLELAREAGFNLVRKHLKLEDPRFHYHADRLGMLVWAEPASTGRYSDRAVKAFSAQIAPMVARDSNHPSIIIWGLYNEEWGLDWDIPGDPAKQEVVRRDYRALKALDPSRPIVDNSGWAHVVTDIVDWHIYDEYPKGWADKLANLMSELTTADAPTFPVGIDVGRVVPKQLLVEGPVSPSLPFMNSEFGGGWTSVDRGWNLHWQTQELRRHDRIAGWIWTELYDIEHESAGIYDAFRTLKDSGSRPAHHANGETALVFDLTPIAPGRDLVTSTEEVEFSVCVSHHGSAPIDAEITFAWGPVFAADATTAPELAGAVRTEPFVLSDPITIRTAVPDGSARARLHVFIRTTDSIIGRGALDVARE